MTSLRIVHAVASDRFAGVEQFVLRLASAQATQGHEVTVIGGAPERMSAALQAAGARPVAAVHTLDVLRAVRRTPADVVNSHMTAADGACAFALLGRRTALVSTRHFASRRGRFGPLPLDAIIRRRVDAEISISRAVASAVGVPSTVVHSGIPPAVGASPGDSKRILMVQRLQPEKHTGIGVQAFAASGLAADGWRLDVVGEGPERDQVAALIEDLGVGDAVRLLGFRDDVPHLLTDASMLLAPCPVEGLGLAVLEAMAHAVAPIAAAAAGHLDLLEGLDERATFRPDDVADAAAALRAFADDANRRGALARAARDRALTEFSLTQQATGTEAVYRDAMSRRGE